jgi:hypothetical protein
MSTGLRSCNGHALLPYLIFSGNNSGKLCSSTRAGQRGLYWSKFLAYNHFSNAWQPREISVQIAADYNSAVTALVNQAVGQLLYLISGRVFCLKPFCLG